MAAPYNITPAEADPILNPAIFEEPDQGNLNAFITTLQNFIVNSNRSLNSTRQYIGISTEFRAQVRAAVTQISEKVDRITAIIPRINERIRVLEERPQQGPAQGPQEPGAGPGAGDQEELERLRNMKAMLLAQLAKAKQAMDNYNVIMQEATFNIDTAQETNRINEITADMNTVNTNLDNILVQLEETANGPLVGGRSRRRRRHHTTKRRISKKKSSRRKPSKSKKQRGGWVYKKRRSSSRSHTRTTRTF